MIVIDDAAGMTKYIWEYLDTIVIGGKMDIVDDLRKDSRDEKEQYKREARTVMRRLLKEAANEIERLRNNQSILITSFRINMMRLRPDYSHEEFDKDIAAMLKEKE